MNGKASSFKLFCSPTIINHYGSQSANHYRSQSANGQGSDINQREDSTNAHRWCTELIAATDATIRQLCGGKLVPYKCSQFNSNPG